jgi:hypothetical protein
VIARWSGGGVVADVQALMMALRCARARRRAGHPHLLLLLAARRFHRHVHADFCARYNAGATCGLDVVGHKYEQFVKEQLQRRAAVIAKEVRGVCRHGCVRVTWMSRNDPGNAV